MNSKKSKLALVGMILTGAYLVYLVFYFTKINSAAADSSEQAGAAIATMLVIPHVLLVFLAGIFNALGYFLNKRGFILTAGILYAVALAVFLPYFMFVLVQMILMFIAFAKMNNSPTTNLAL